MIVASEKCISLSSLLELMYLTIGRRYLVYIGSNVQLFLLQYIA